MSVLHDISILEPDNDYALHITAKRYWSSAFEIHRNDPQALTLIFLHSTSFHKETWEPTIEALFTHMNSNATNTKIREAWVIECPNHGASAELNEVAIRLPQFRDNFTCNKYAIAAHRFLIAGSTKGAKVDFRSRRLVGLGHSLGSVALTILQNLDSSLNFQAMVLVEPMLSPGGPEFLHGLRKELVRSAYERCDVWSSRESAYAYLKARPRTQKWHPRVLELYTEFGLRLHPGSRFVESPYTGVTLSCSRDEEAAMYRDVDDPKKPISDLNDACARMPVHIIFGDANDYLPRMVHDAVTDPKSGRRFASITRIKDAGHLVPQQAPDALAEVFYGILMSITNDKRTTARSKL